VGLDGGFEVADERLALVLGSQDGGHLCAEHLGRDLGGHALTERERLLGQPQRVVPARVEDRERRRGHAIPVAGVRVLGPLGQGRSLAVELVEAFPVAALQGHDAEEGQDEDLGARVSALLGVAACLLRARLPLVQVLEAQP
jgi:hypothetical protein